MLLIIYVPVSFHWCFLFFFNAPATTEIYTLSLHDALPILSADYAGADVVLVNTCGFLDSAKEESLEAIGEAIAENGRVIVTGCMGKEADLIRAKFPNVLAVTGAHQYEEVVGAVHVAAPVPPSAYLN